MSDQLFLITGGGTGAKVAESFTHLCAAGLAPAEVHVLLVDTDATNGNVQRTTSTEQAYNNLQRYPWSVQTEAQTEKGGWIRSGTSETVGTSLFSTDLFMYRLTDPLATVIGGGLDTAVGDNTDVQQVLELLYDGSERTAKCDDGFRARPNLGCLHLADHLNTVLLENQQSRNFINALANATSGTSGSVPVVVTASVFGGTGASLIPVVRGCVEQAMERSRGNVDLRRLTWSVVKVLPHYQPKHRVASVDPDRFLLDTASALQFYSKVYRSKASGSNGEAMYNGVYVIGSDQPGRNTVEPTLGSEDQSNPSYFEEFLAALAVLHAAEGGKRSSNERVRMFMPSTDTGVVDWANLPFYDNGRLRNQFAYLLHLAAFYLVEGGRSDHSKGLDKYISDTPPHHLAQETWYKTLIDPWATNFPVYESATTERRPELLQGDAALGNKTYGYTREDIAEYFGRLLMWTETALKGPNLSLVDYRDSNYAALHSAMSALGSDELNRVRSNGQTKPLRPDQDNAMVRTLRAALSAMLRLSNGDVTLKVDVDQFQLVDGKEDYISLAIPTPDVEKAMRRNRLGSILSAHTLTMA